MGAKQKNKYRIWEEKMIKKMKIENEYKPISNQTGL